MLPLKAYHHSQVAFSWLLYSRTGLFFNTSVRFFFWEFNIMSFDHFNILPPTVPWLPPFSTHPTLFLCLNFQFINLLRPKHVIQIVLDVLFSQGDWSTYQGLHTVLEKLFSLYLISKNYQELHSLVWDSMSSSPHHTSISLGWGLHKFGAYCQNCCGCICTLVLICPEVDVLL